MAKRLPRVGRGWQCRRMTEPRDIRNLALVGFMGSGKSTVGRMVARQLGLTFVDTDEAVEARTGKRISAIFETEGEAAFRALEREALAELVGCDDQVIATGGGLVCQPGNLDLLKSRSLVVCLWASPETIWERVRNQTHRPLLRVEDPQAEIRRLIHLRSGAYRQADVLVNSGLRSLREVATHVAHHYRMARSKGGGG